LAPGAVQDELISNGLGNTQSTSYALGEYMRSLGSLTRNEHHPHGRVGIGVALPAEALVYELLIREDTHGPLHPAGIVYRGIGGDWSYELGKADQLDITETVSYLGKWPVPPQGQDVPRHDEMCRYVFDQLGWEASRFDVYRLRVDYPITPSSPHIVYNLPDRLYASA
jgi:hypothetical protein